MFTGIIEDVGSIARLDKRGSDARISVQVGKLDMSDVALGDSIAVNGVCLTAVELDDSHFVADVSGETLSKTALGNLGTGSEVNLEKALTPTTRLGGHLVSGHVDGVGKVLEIRDEGQAIFIRIEAPAELAKYIAMKGSICIDGVSLTVNGVNGAEFDLTIVPHTQQETTIKHYRQGTAVNLEVDLIARYLERLILGEQAAHADGTGITEAFLEQAGLASGSNKT
jgi:riboflavin synthase